MKWIAILAAALLTACTQIDTGNVGVESAMGQVKPEILPPGVYFTFFKTVEEVSGKEIPLQIEDLRPQTSDKITLADLDMDIYIQIDASKAPAIKTRWPGDTRTLDKDDAVALGLNYVTRQAREAIYTDIAKRGSATVHTERAKIASEVVKALQADLDLSAGKGWFFVRSANIRNLVTDPALEANIKATANAQFERLKKDQEIEVAKREAERLRIAAQGEADAIRIKAAAIGAQGGDDYVRLQAIEKWDGKLPVTQAGGAVPFINLK